MKTRVQRFCILAGLAGTALLASSGTRAEEGKPKPALKSHFTNRADPAIAPRKWAPPDVDETVPVVAPDAPCALDKVLPSAGRRAEELIANLQQFTAVEQLDHAKIDAQGRSRGMQIRRFNYMVAIGEPRPGMLSVDEYRNGGTSLEDFPAHLATTGLPAFALIFHPYLVGDFQMSCEGLGTWHGQPAWQVHFQQRPDRISRIRSYRVRGGAFPVKLKGRAWIAADSFQVVRLETDLLEPIKAIPLEREHLVIEYRAVRFQHRHVELWLPERAELFLDYRRHRYHRLHTFRDFALFSVDVSERIEDPKEIDP
jgi:hypothetical protein